MNEGTSPAIKSPEHFYSLDTLRGVAALSVVVCHWQHFFFVGTTEGTLPFKQYPMYDMLFALYTKGWLAVDLFFGLSGFVFYWLYSRRIAEAKVSTGKFAWLRFSRLYPLHFVTLLAVAAEQIWILRTQGTHYIFPYNDSKHLVLHLLFASSWGLESGYSFNAPVWSVSVEVLLYGLFFVLCRFLPVRAVVLGTLSLIGLFVVSKFYLPLGRGIGSFFLGGCVYLAYQQVLASRHALRITQVLASLTVISWIVTITVIHPAASFSLPSFRAVPLLSQFDAALTFVLSKVISHWAEMILFPLTILSLALVETHRGSLGKRLSFLGNISYSSYLLHFPLQLLTIALVSYFSVPLTLYNSLGFMIVFFAILLVLSFASYYYFELPMQKLLRRLGSPRRLPLPESQAV